MSEGFSCDCGHCSYTYNICSVCDQSICLNCSENGTNLGTNDGICRLCIEHRISVEKLCDFIEKNVNLLEYLQNDKLKYYKYKKYLELLRTIYLHIKNFDSFNYEGEAYNYLSEPEIIYNLIKKFTNKLYYIYNNSDNFLYAE